MPALGGVELEETQEEAQEETRKSELSDFIEDDNLSGPEESDVPDVPDVPCDYATDATEQKKETGFEQASRKSTSEQQSGQQTNDDDENTLSADAQVLLQALENNKCAAVNRAVTKHFKWGTRRAAAALRELRAAGYLKDK